MAGVSWIAPPCLPAQTTAPAPAPAPAPSTAPASVADPATVLNAPTATQAERDEAARRLVLRSTPEAQTALLSALQGAGNRSAQLAAARAVTLDPTPDPAYVIPLFALLSAQSPLPETAIGALAAYQDAPDLDVKPRLIELAVDPQHQQRETTRLAAIRAVGTMTDKRAARVLVNLVAGDAETKAVRDAAALALANMTATAANQRDPAQWQQWWTERQNLDEPGFERELLIARSAQLTRLQHQLGRVVNEGQMLLIEAYQSAPEARKEAMLLRYLRAGEPETRAVGAQLVELDFKQPRAIPQSVRDQLRVMVGDSSSKVRVQVAKDLFLLNDEQAFDALLQQLSREPDPEVRSALAQAMVPMRDVRVAPVFLNLLADPSLAVAEVAATGLGDPDLSDLIRKDPQLASRTAVDLQKALDARTGPGTVALRAAIVDAMGALQNPNLRGTYTRVLRPNEAVAVRCAALRALGELGKPNGQTWPADLIDDSLSDSEEAVRLEAVRALKTTADFGHADALYDLVKRQSSETSERVRAEAWGVLQGLFADEKASNEQLNRWADRFRDEPLRRIAVLQVLVKRLANQPDALAAVQQNLGEALMKLSNDAAAAGDYELARTRAEEADAQFDPALKYYRSKNPTDQDMTTSALVAQRIDALLAAKKFDDAVSFAAGSISISPSNQESMGPRLRNSVDRLSKSNPDEARRLIEAINKMNPKLADQFLDPIKRIDQQLRGGNTAPRSAGGKGEDSIGRSE